MASAFFSRCVAGRAVLLALALPAVSAAQQGGRLTGVVFDSTIGRPLVNVTVTISPGNRAALSDSLGAFRFDDVKAGSYEVRADHRIATAIPGALRAANVIVRDGQWAIANLVTPSATAILKSSCPGMASDSIDAGQFSGKHSAVVGSVTWVDGSPEAGATVLVIREGGRG
jgi:hypothetical protein